MIVVMLSVSSLSALSGGLAPVHPTPVRGTDAGPQAAPPSPIPPQGPQGSGGAGGSGPPPMLPRGSLLDRSV
jgi:hypothetical protein